MERPPALVVETTEYPFGREKRIWRLGFVEQVAHPLSGFSSGVTLRKTDAGKRYGDVFLAKSLATSSR